MKGASLKAWMRQRLWLLWEPDSDDNSHGVAESADTTSNWWSVGAAVAKSILWVDGIFGYLGLKHVDMYDGGGSLKKWPQLMNYVVTVIDGTPVTVIDDTPVIGVCRGVRRLIQCRWSVCRWSYTFDSVPPRHCEVPHVWYPEVQSLTSSELVHWWGWSAQVEISPLVSYGINHWINSPESA